MTTTQYLTSAPSALRRGIALDTVVADISTSGGIRLHVGAAVQRRRDNPELLVHHAQNFWTDGLPDTAPSVLGS